MIEGRMKEKYYFNDLYVFGKTANGYISLSDYELSYNLCTPFQHDSRFLLGVRVSDGYYISDITLDELMCLAGVSTTTNFIRQCRCGVDAEAADEVLAILCAKKILNTKFGRLEVSNNNKLTYHFLRRKSEGKNRIYNVVCEKQFKKGIIENVKDQIAI